MTRLGRVQMLSPTQQLTDCIASLEIENARLTEELSDHRTQCTNLHDRDEYLRVRAERELDAARADVTALLDVITSLIPVDGEIAISDLCSVDWTGWHYRVRRGNIVTGTYETIRPALRAAGVTLSEEEEA